MAAPAPVYHQLSLPAASIQRRSRRGQSANPVVGRDARDPWRAARGFDFPRGTDMWAPRPDTGSSALVDLVARLAPDASDVQGRAELDAFLSGPNAPDPGESRDVEAASEPIETAVTGSARPLLGALGAAVGLLLCMTIVSAASCLSVGRRVACARWHTERTRRGAGPATAPLARECLGMAAVGAVVAVGVGMRPDGLLALAPPSCRASTPSRSAGVSWRVRSPPRSQ